MKLCPRCKKDYPYHPAISRRDGKTEICPDCGLEEATFDFDVMMNRKTIAERDEEKAWLK